MVVHLRTMPGRFVVTLTDEPIRVASSINQRRHPDLVFPGGRLEAITQNVYTTRDGKRRGDIRVRYLPDGGTMEAPNHTTPEEYRDRSTS